MMGIEQVILEILGVLVKIAPGFLALFSGAKTDEEALDRAKAAVGALKRRPAASAIDDYADRAARGDEPTAEVPLPAGHTRPR